VAALLAVLCLLSWVLIAGVHVDDTYHVSDVSATWLTLAQNAQHGTLYPPLYDGAVFGGTRYMPGQILAYAGAAEATGDRLVGAKLMVYALALALLGALFLALRRFDCPIPVALGLVAVAVASSVGLVAATTIAGDALPMVLQLSALLVLTQRSGGRSAAVAGVLCALAMLAKFSALWAPAAIVVWLLARERARLVPFVAAFGLALAAGVGATEVASDGRFSDNLFGLSGASFMGFDSVLRDSPGKLITLAETHAVSVVIVIPFVLVSLLLGMSERRISVYHLSFLFALGLLLVVLADPGAYYNHLLDVTILAVILVGDLWRRATDAKTGSGMMRTVILAAIVCAVGLGYYTDVKPEAAEAARILLGRADRQEYANEPPRGVFRTTDRILSEDPYIPLALGQHPVVLDAFMLLRIAQKHPDWQADLVRRLDGHEFDKVILLQPLDSSLWWREVDFGIPLIEAIERNYRLGQRLRWRNLWIYVPKPAPPSAASEDSPRSASSRRVLQ
jgi:hypothetical protein